MPEARRTRLGEATTTALFVLDALDPMTDDGLRAAADALAGALTQLGTGVTVAARTISGP